MSTIRQTLTPLLERRQLEITKLRSELAAANTRIAELEAQLEAAKKKK